MNPLLHCRPQCAALRRVERDARELNRARRIREFVADDEREPQVRHGSRVDGRAREQRGRDDDAQRHHRQQPPSRHTPAQHEWKD